MLPASRATRPHQCLRWEGTYKLLILDSGGWPSTQSALRAGSQEPSSSSLQHKGRDKNSAESHTESTRAPEAPLCAPAPCVTGSHPFLCPGCAPGALLAFSASYFRSPSLPGGMDPHPSFPLAPSPLRPMFALQALGTRSHSNAHTPQPRFVASAAPAPCPQPPKLSDISSKPSALGQQTLVPHCQGSRAAAHAQVCRQQNLARCSRDLQPLPGGCPQPYKAPSTPRGCDNWTLGTRWGSGRPCRTGGEPQKRAAGQELAWWWLSGCEQSVQLPPGAQASSIFSRRKNELCGAGGTPALLKIPFCLSEGTAGCT